MAEKEPACGFLFAWANVTTGTGGTTSSYTTAATSVASDSGALFQCLITSSCGIIISNSATLTVNNAPPSVPTVVSPSNGAQNVALNPTLIWSSIGAAVCTLKVSASNFVSDSATYVISGGVLQYALSGLLTSTTYYWKVNATNAYGASGYSSTWNFTTVPPAPGAPTNLAAGSITTTTATLSWTGSSGATSYNIQASVNSDFSPLR